MESEGPCLITIQNYLPFIMAFTARRSYGTSLVETMLLNNSRINQIFIIRNLLLSFYWEVYNKRR
jgi:hypothetical protein